MLVKWKAAQEQEQEAWEDIGTGTPIDSPQEWRDFLGKRFCIDFGVFHAKSVLEIGCGPLGIIHFIEPDHGLRVGVDSLLFTYEKHDNFHRIRAIGEFLPLRGEFEVVVCFNVLDHCLLPRMLLREAALHARTGGVLLLWVHTTRKAVRFLVKRIDRYHPHHFSMEEVRHMVSEAGFGIRALWASPAGYEINEPSFNLREFIRILRTKSIKTAIYSLIKTDTCLVCMKP